MTKPLFFGIVLFALAALPARPGAASGPAQPAYTSKPVAVYLTAKDTGQRLARTADLTFTDAPALNEKKHYIFVDPTRTFQTVLGIGGALTDASAETFYKLPEASRQRVLKAYFDDKEGIGYTLGRTNIHSCDFSSSSYTYVADNDTDLKTFSIAHDLKYRIPFIKEVLAMTGKDFTIFASPWSPPAWMKSNHSMLHGGALLPQYYDTWAKYCVKFIQAYEKEGIPIWGMTPQNEPLAVQKFDSCVYSAAQERDYIKNDLGPELARAGLGSKKILIWDHNRDMMYQWARVILDDPKAARYVWGMGFHWYGGDHFENVKRVHDAWPKLPLMLTEACADNFYPDKINDWKWGEHYGRSMISDFNSGAVGWTDWNVLLDQQGGPNHVGNYCFAPIHGDTRTGKLTFMNTYYYIGHFSKFVRPGARRIISSSSCDDLLTTAFLNKDGTVAVIVMNTSPYARPFYMFVGDKAARAASPGHSISTLVF